MLSAKQTKHKTTKASSTRTRQRVFSPAISTLPREYGRKEEEKKSTNE